ncbi:unnamed protein product [Camellia sinensis]
MERENLERRNPTIPSSPGRASAAYIKEADTTVEAEVEKAARRKAERSSRRRRRGRLGQRAQEATASVLQERLQQAIMSDDGGLLRSSRHGRRVVTR